MKYEWLNCEECSPSEHGYYYTYYYNTEQRDYFFKAIMWHDNNWCFWRKFEVEPKVLYFIKESRNEYYIPCEEWAHERNLNKVE